MNRDRLMMGGGSAYNHFRLTVTAVDGGSSIRVGELQLMVGAVAHPTINMASSSTAGYIASASTAGASLDPWRAFDGSNTSRWGTTASPTQWVQLQVPAALSLTSFKVTESGGDAATSAPKDFTLAGSNSGAFGGEEVTLATVTDSTSWGNEETREFSI